MSTTTREQVVNAHRIAIIGALMAHGCAAAVAEKFVTEHVRFDYDTSGTLASCNPTPRRELRCINSPEECIQFAHDLVHAFPDAPLTGGEPGERRPSLLDPYARRLPELRNRVASTF